MQDDRTDDSTTFSPQKRSYQFVIPCKALVHLGPNQTGQNYIGIMGDQFSDPLEPLGAIVLW